ncbi:Hypothetical protein PACV_303 [Pacmanvirus A23]|uniref:Hypothetical protein n=1 Tax=Pacmanvirus A23 TaxID=1932881 RepID=UPI000A0933BC|nr:Hypothetical protein B9W72_gp299 [Pacmanvirus A23]SIP86016.1 Hypothetical protein PACV_303 [Pacmanvirus A23]
MESLLQKCTNCLTEMELLWLEKYEIPSDIICISLQKHHTNDIINYCKDSYFIDISSGFLNKLGNYCQQHAAISLNIKNIKRVLPPKIFIGDKRIYKHSLKYTINNELIIVMRIMENRPPIIAFHNRKWDRYECIKLDDRVKYEYIYKYFDVDTRVPSTYMSQPFVNEKDWC